MQNSTTEGEKQHDGIVINPKKRTYSLGYVLVISVITVTSVMSVVPAISNMS